MLTDNGRLINELIASKLIQDFLSYSIDLYLIP